MSFDVYCHSNHYLGSKCQSLTKLGSWDIGSQFQFKIQILISKMQEKNHRMAEQGSVQAYGKKLNTDRPQTESKLKIISTFHFAMHVQYSHIGGLTHCFSNTVHNDIKPGKCCKLQSGTRPFLFCCIRVWETIGLISAQGCRNGVLLLHGTSSCINQYEDEISRSHLKLGVPCQHRCRKFFYFLGTQ